MSGLRRHQGGRKFDAIHLKKVRDWHADSFETMPIKAAAGLVKKAGNIVKRAVTK